MAIRPASGTALTGLSATDFSANLQPPLQGLNAAIKTALPDVAELLSAQGLLSLQGSNQQANVLTALEAQGVSTTSDEMKHLIQQIA